MLWKSSHSSVVLPAHPPSILLPHKFLVSYSLTLCSVRHQLTHTMSKPKLPSQHLLDKDVALESGLRVAINA